MNDVAAVCVGGFLCAAVGHVCFKSTWAAKLHTTMHTNVDQSCKRETYSLYDYLIELLKSLKIVLCGNDKG